MHPTDELRAAAKALRDPVNNLNNPLAEPLAAWLEGITRRHNLSPDSDYQYRCIWCNEPWPCPDLRDALAAARAVLGSDR